MDTLLSKVTKAAKLITLPETYLRLKNLLDDPDFAMAEVAVIISRDPAITLRLLRLVNSSFYGFTSKVETVSRAITLLGVQQVHDIVLATAVAHTFEGIPAGVVNMNQFWRRSVYCAVAARRLSALCGCSSKERLFVAGLLHDIGHLLMYQAIPDHCQQVIATAKERNEPIYMVERDILGFDYGRAGGEFMHQWPLPGVLTETTMFHVEPGDAGRYAVEIALVHIGALLSKAGNGEGTFNEGPLKVEPAAWSVTGLSPQTCTTFTSEIEEEVREVKSLLAPVA